MAYPDVTADEVRRGIPHIDSDIVSDAIVDEIIVDSTDETEGRFVGAMDLTTFKTISPTPKLWQRAIIFLSRVYTLDRAYSDGRASGSASDIAYWQKKFDDLVNQLMDGKLKMVDSDGTTIIGIGMGYNSIKTNKQEIVDDDQYPYLGYGDEGQGLDDQADRTQY